MLLHLMYEETRHLEGLYVATLNVRRATTPLVFSMLLQAMQQGHMLLHLMYDPFRVYILLQVM